MQKVAVDGCSVSRSAEVLRLAYKNGKADAATLDYIPMPDNVIAVMRARGRTSRTRAVKAVWP